MKNIFKLLVCFVAALAAVSCGRKVDSAEMGEALYTPLYSGGFDIYATEGQSTVLKINSLYDSFNDASEYIFISRNGEKLPDSLAWQTIEAPLRRVVCMSSSHVAFIDALGGANTIKGVSGADYISNETVRANIEKGLVGDIGYDTHLNYEIIADMRPDAVFIYGIGGKNTAMTDKMREMGLKVVTVSEHLEENPLGKAEWIVMFGELFDKRAKAEEIFASIAGKYDSLKTMAATFTEKPKVMLNAPYKDVWFVPGDRSYIVRLINDAGAEYACAGENLVASRPISAETAYLAANGSDVWLNPGQYLTLGELTLQNPKFANIKPVAEGRVYNCVKRRTPAGGSDFWESGALRADRVLEDLIMCLHPEWPGGSEAEPYYFIKLL